MVFLDVGDPGWPCVQCSGGVAEGQVMGFALGGQFSAGRRVALGFVWSGQGFVDLTGDRAFQGPDDVFLGLVLPESALDVGTGGGVVAHAHQRDPVQGAVGLAGRPWVHRDPHRFRFHLTPAPTPAPTSQEIRNTVHPRRHPRATPMPSTPKSRHTLP